MKETQRSRQDLEELIMMMDILHAQLGNQIQLVRNASLQWDASMMVQKVFSSSVLS